MKRLASLLLFLPYALGFLVGLLVLAVVVVALAVRDGYAAGRRLPE